MLSSVSSAFPTTVVRGYAKVHDIETNLPLHTPSLSISRKAAEIERGL